MHAGLLHSAEQMFRKALPSSRRTWGAVAFGLYDAALLALRGRLDDTIKVSNMPNAVTSTKAANPGPSQRWDVTSCAL